MDLKILLATPDQGLSEQISQALLDADYSPLSASSTAEAAFIVQYEKCPIAILDCELSDPGPAYLATELRAQFKDLRIIFINSSELNPISIEINPTRDILLPPPFFLPDLLEVIHLWFAEKKASHDEVKIRQEPQVIPTELAWLEDVNQAAQYLTRLSLEVDAQAALIVQNASIWAYAGQLNQDAAVEITQLVGHYWAHGDGGDMVHFVRLANTGVEHMLYVTNLGAGFVLALSFGREMPFSKMRSQTGELARKLTSRLEIPHLDFEDKPVQEELPQHGWLTTKEPNLRKSEAFEEIDKYDEDSEVNDAAIIERQQAMFEDLLATLDIPDPDGLIQPAAIGTEIGFEQPVGVQQQESEFLPNTNIEPSLVMEVAPVKDTDPLSLYDVQLEPGSLGMHDLAYACVIIPRLPEHHLTGVLTGLLEVETARLCLAFGWRLEHLAIRPQYFHWVVSVTPDVPASSVIQKIREETSTLLFNEFPRLEKENPSGDFWAKGFLVIHGRNPLSNILVGDFIQKTRVRQGIEN